MNLEIGQELEVRQAIEFAGRTIPEGCHLRVGAMMTEFFEPNVAVVLLDRAAPETVILPRHFVTLNCRPVAA